MITIRNTQRKIKINVVQLKKDAQTILDALKYSDFDLGIWLTSNTMIHKYNKEYRHKDKPTDILSFPYHTELKAGERIKAKTEEDKNVGDLIIAPEYVMHDVPKWNTTFEKHLQRLLVHGICHLLGYDHIEDADYKIMHRKEMALLKKLSARSPL
jgi:rRNA maturation RNase YbeY